MKKIYCLIIVLVVFHFAASAQYTQGRILFDGNVNFNNDNSKFTNINYATNSTTYNLSPNVGYFIMNNLVVGIGMDYQSYYNNSSRSTINIDNSVNGISTKTIITTTSIKWTELAPAVFVKYIMPISDKLSFSLKAKYSYGLLSDNSVISQDTVSADPKGVVSVNSNILKSEKPSINSTRLNLSAGFQYLITNKIGLEVNFAGFSINSVPKIHVYDEITYQSAINWGTESTTIFNINPSSWSFGVFLLL